MKPLNHKDRRRAIWKFIWSVFPVLLITLIGLLLLFKNSRMHSLFIENKYNIQKMKFVEQAKINEKIDSILTFGNKIMDVDMAEDQYSQTQKMISTTVDNSLSYSILQQKGAPYEVALNIVKNTQLALDSFHTINNEYVKKFQRLKACDNFYDENIKR